MGRHDPAKHAAYMREWRKRPGNAAKSDAWAKRWKAANPEVVRGFGAKHYQQNRDRIIARTAAWIKANPVAHSRHSYFGHVRRKYNVSRERFDAMLIAQAGRCAICTEPMVQPCVDHDHACCPHDSSCGACVRGLLCQSCNQGLACFKDSPEIMAAASDYLSASGRRAVA